MGSRLLRFVAMVALLTAVVISPRARGALRASARMVGRRRFLWAVWKLVRL